MLRGLVVSAVLLGGAAAVADRVAVTVAERAVAATLRDAADLSADPDVDIRGFPFLTQAVAGSFGEVRVAADAVTAAVGPDTLVVDDFVVDLLDVEVAASDALRGKVDQAPVGRLTARASVGFAELSRVASRRSETGPLLVSRRGSDLAVTGEVDVAGRTTTVTGVGRLTLTGGRLVVRAQELLVGGKRAPAAVVRAVGDDLDVSLPVDGLPFGLRLTGVTVVGDGISLSVAARDTVLQAAEVQGPA